MSNKLRIVKSHNELIKDLVGIDSNGKDFSIQKMLKPSRIEAKDGYNIQNADVYDIIRVIKSLMQIYPEYMDMLKVILLDSTEDYTFRSDINTFADFKRELSKFYIHNDGLARLLAPEINSDIDIYEYLYQLYKKNGAQCIQDRIKNMQSLDCTNLVMAENMWGIAESMESYQHVFGQHVSVDDIPDFSNIDIGDKP